MNSQYPLLFIYNNQFFQRDLVPYPNPLLSPGKPGKIVTLFMKLQLFWLGKKEVHIEIHSESVLT